MERAKADATSVCASGGDLRDQRLLSCARQNAARKGGMPGQEACSTLDRFAVLFENAAVNQDVKSRLPRALGRRLMDDAFLHPYGLRADPDRRLDDLRDVLGTPEDVDDVDLFRNILQAGIALF